MKNKHGKTKQQVTSTTDQETTSSENLVSERKEKEKKRQKGREHSGQALRLPSRMQTPVQRHLQKQLMSLTILYSNTERITVPE